MDENQLLLFNLLKPELKKNNKSPEKNYEQLYGYLNSLQGESNDSSATGIHQISLRKDLKKMDQMEKIRRNMFQMMDRETKIAFSK
jgi:hypothetical protein